MTAAARATKSQVEFAHTLADISGRAILPHFRRAVRIDDKGAASGTRFDPVTTADRAAERALRRAIIKKFPDQGIVGEEFGTITGASRFKWVLDPIDGTRAFIMGSPLWGTLIGLLDGSTPILGLMDQPFTGERFWSDQRATRLRDADGKVRRLQTRGCSRLSDATFTTTHPDLFSTEPELMGLNQLKARARMTRYGGDCYGYCLLAAGFVDLVVEVGLKPFDIVALVPIIEAAGGVVTTWEGESAAAGGRIVAAGDARVHRQAIALLRSIPDQR